MALRWQRRRRAHDHRRPGSGHRGGAERNCARAQSTLSRDHDGAGQAPACLRPRGEADRGGVSSGLRLRERHRPEFQRVPQRGRAGVGLARRFDPGVPAQQRQQRRDRDHGQPARPVLAHRLAAHRKRRLDRPLADAGAGAVLQHRGQGPRRQAGGRRRGRRLAVLDRGSLRESGPDAGRHEPARQVHDRQERPICIPQHQARRLSDPDHRAGRRPDRRRAATTCGRRTCIS